MNATAAEAFLRTFHRGNPSATSRALAWGRLPNGGSSYDHLAAVVAAGTPRARVLDLACGEGHLRGVVNQRVVELEYIGVDMCEEELALGRAACQGENAAFLCERAQALTIATSSIDVALCHMALMLFDEIELVLCEVGRVLVGGGVFAAIVGRASDGRCDLFSAFGALCREIDPGPVDLPRLGDRRTDSEAGLRELFAASLDFDVPIEIDDFSLDLCGDVDQVWRSLALTYNPARLSSDQWRTLEARTRQLAAERAVEGLVPFHLALRRLIARRRPRGLD